MYSRVYSISWPAEHTEALLAHYDSVIADAIRGSKHHIGHQVVSAGPTQWLLISNYTSRQGAEAAAPMVRDLISHMVENFGMSIEVIGEGDTTRAVS